jgi:hypothetical protein
MASNKFFTLEKAVLLGEYNVKVLNQFPEFKILSRHAQFQLIDEALHNKEKHLWKQWADINNQLNFSKKPYLAEGLLNVQKQIDALHDDMEKLLIEYSK